MSVPVNELSDRVGQELFVSDWVVVRLEQELAFQAATLLTKEDLGFDPASDDPYGPELVSGFLLLSLLVHFHKKHRLSPAEGLYGLNYGSPWMIVGEVTHRAGRAGVSACMGRRRGG